MFDMEKIMSLNADEIVIANALQSIAEQAKKDAKLIADTYHCFGIGEDTIEVWHDRDLNNFEYLTHDGVWQARYLHQSYDIKVDADTIFDYYRAEWLIENGYAKETEENSYKISPMGAKANVCRYFKSFVRRINIENN